MSQNRVFKTETPLLDTLRAEGIWSTWRGGVSDCPYCSYRHYTVWLERPYLKQIILQSALNNPTDVVTISECPACRELSWCHDSIWVLLGSSFLSAREQQLVLEESDRRKTLAKQQWEQCLCRRCKWLKTKPMSDYNAYIHCESPKSSRSSPVAFECDDFSETTTFI